METTINDLDLKKLRDETPGCEHVLHFNNAGASLPPSCVVTAIKNHIDLEALIGGYEAEELELAKIERFYDAAAKLINCNRDEIAFTENATRAWDMIFYGFKFTNEDKIITSAAEYGSNYLAFLQMAKQTGVKIEVINNDDFGQIDLKELRNKFDSRVKLIAITHVPTQGGLVNPVAAVGKIANEMQIPYLLDATQSVGQMPIDVKAIGCDFLCATGRKYLRGPRGTGFLYVKKDCDFHISPPFINLHSATWIAENDYQIRQDARRFETWEQNIAAKIGLGVAIDYALALGIPRLWQRIRYLATQLRQQLALIPALELHDLGQVKCGIITFTCKNISPEKIQKSLAKQKINVIVSRQEYARLDMTKRHLPLLVRASLHYYNTEEEIERFCAAIHAL